MANDFRKIGEEAVGKSLLLNGRTKMTTDEVVGKDLTIVAFDLLPRYNDGVLVIDGDGAVETRGVVVFKEAPDRYYNVGAIFTKVCRAWAACYDNTAEASADLEKQGGVAVRFRTEVNRKGKEQVNFDFVD